MMLLLPYSTDAPVYHWPFATGGIILANVLLFGATSETFLYCNYEDPVVQQLVLHFDQLNPLQWLTQNFMHADLMHLLGNMFFLWAYGIVVEGNLGWWRFLLLYLFIGVLQGAIIQLAMLALSSSSGAALGASGAIFGLLGMATLWAPESELSCLLLIGIWARLFEIRIWAFSFLFFALQIVFALLSGLQMSSAMLHLTGLAIGTPIGILALRRRWVDCDGQDALTRWSNSGQATRQTELARDAATSAIREQQQHRKQIQRAVSQAFDDGNLLVAGRLFLQHGELLGFGRHLPPSQVMPLIGELLRRQQWAAAGRALIVQLGTADPQRAIGIRLRLARLLILQFNRPRQAVLILSHLPPDLPPQAASTAAQIRARARRTIAAGILELHVEKDEAQIRFE